MYLDDLDIGESLTIHVENNGLKMDFPVTIMENEFDIFVKGHHCFTNASMYYVKVVAPNLSISHFSVFWYNSEEDQTYEFLPVRITLINEPGVLAYCIQCDSEGFTVNRRAFYRVPLYAEGSIILGEAKKKKFQCTLHDLSMSGVAVNIRDFPSNLDVRGAHFTCRFHDPVLHSEVVLVGICVRKQEIGETITRLGCRIVGADADLSKYINNKQTEYLKAHGNHPIV